MITPGEFRDRPHNSVWNSLSQLMTVFIMLVLIAGALAMILPELPRQRAQQAGLDVLKEKVEKQKLLLAKQERELQWLRTNPEYLEIFARDRLGMMKEGETVYRVEVPPK